MLGVSMLLVMAVQHLRSRSRHPRLVVAAIGALLLFELLPAPRTLYSAEMPDVYRIVAADPRPIRVLSLPFGLRDGISSRGNYSSSSQFYQTFHEKRLVGGYISRLPGGSVERYRSNPTLRVLLRLSEGTPVDPELYEEALQQADRNMRRLADGLRSDRPEPCSPELIAFAHRVFQMTPGHEGGLAGALPHADGAGATMSFRPALPLCSAAASEREATISRARRSRGEGGSDPLVSHDRSGRRRCHQRHR